MEACVDSVSSAINASLGGAIRLELCSALELGGLTATVGLLKLVKSRVKIPVFPIVRPRKGDFLYTDVELEIMTHDVTALKENGADGIVIGALNRVIIGYHLTEWVYEKWGLTERAFSVVNRFGAAVRQVVSIDSGSYRYYIVGGRGHIPWNRDGTIDTKSCETLISAARPLPVTFHRAFDVASDPIRCLDDIINLGCERLLTSGQQPTAFEGVKLIRQLIQKAGGNIIIVPGGGITEDNLNYILEKTGAKEFHASARVAVPSEMTFRNVDISMGSEDDEYTNKTCSEQRVNDMVKIARNFGI